MKKLCQSIEKMYDISVIIPTYKREKVLCDTIESVCQEISYARDSGITVEMIVVDQTMVHLTSTRTFLELMNSFSYYQYIYVERANLPNARNIGILKSRGNIIVFIDDDVLLERGFFKECYDTYRRNIDIDSVVGRVTLVNESRENILLNNSSYLKDTIRNWLRKLYGRNKAGIITNVGIILSNFSLLSSNISDCGRGCNMSFRKNVLIEIGMFDDNYEGNALREETDCFLRLKRSNKNVFYNHKMHLLHIMANNGGTRVNYNTKYWEIYFNNQIYFYRKNYNASLLRIGIILIFDIIKCMTNGINVFSLFRRGEKRANYLLNK